jgi:hypothetical protein
MSLFQSISGFISSAITGPDSGVSHMTSSATSFTDVMTSALNAVQPALSGDRSSQFSPGTPGFISGRRRTSSTSSSSSSSTSATMPPPPPPSSSSSVPGPDLSHLSAEEQRQIEAVLARAAAQMTDGVAAAGVEPPARPPQGIQMQQR